MIGTLCVIASALFFGVIGVAAFLRPHNLLEGFGLRAEAIESRNEIRGVYGGFPLVVAGLLLFSLTRPDLSDGILFALAFSSAGMAAGRIVSALIDRHMGRHPAIFTVLELIVAALIASNIKSL
jgi:hypothetical protein